MVTPCKTLDIGGSTFYKAMSKFYTASTQVKELCDEAKATKEKSKELNNEVFLKKGEVIRLTEELTCLQGIETKLKNEVEDLKADSNEKETHITHLEVKVQEFHLVLGEGSEGSHCSLYEVR